VATHLVLGAGPIGTAVTHYLLDRGDTVTLVSRRGLGPDLPGVRLVAADAADAEVVTTLAHGTAALYNCINPAYHRWQTDWPPVAAAVLLAAERSGAVLATASNLYGYGPVAAPMTEHLPLAAPGTKGAVRARMFTQALQAHQAGRVRMTEVRGSDYVGPDAESHLGERVVPRVLAGRRVSVLGSADQPHTWTFTRDMARMLVVAANDERAWGRAWHAPSTAPRTQREAIDDLARVAGVAAVRVGTVPRAVLIGLGLVNPTMRELRETLYQFEQPFVMDSSDAQRTFGMAPTPWDDVLDVTLRSYGWAGAPAAS
jgi:nucleoside-diphosphate-sugar epimerase